VWLRLGTGASGLLECLDGLCSVLSVSGLRTSLLALLFFGPPLLLVPEWGVCGLWRRVLSASVRRCLFAVCRGLDLGWTDSWLFCACLGCAVPLASSLASAFFFAWVGPLAGACCLLPRSCSCSRALSLVACASPLASLRYLRLASLVHLCGCGWLALADARVLPAVVLGWASPFGS
jgi:hypothetical protein